MKTILKHKPNEAPTGSAVAGESIPLPAMIDARPRVHGKFLFVGEEKLYVRGVTYGTFRTGADGVEVYDPQVVEADFELMAAN